MRFNMVGSLVGLVIIGLAANCRAAERLALPAQDGTASIAAQEWPLKPGPREIKVFIHYPGGKLANVNSSTGLMLSLHNWGGSACVGTADPATLAKRLDVVAICVDYLQSGKQASIDDPEPYDFGWLQALDALRALHFVFDSLRSEKRPFASDRIFATGGSGGGNVTLMANKLAPRTFTCIVPMCGMAKLSDDIAFNQPGGSSLNARYVRDPQHPFYLSPDAQDVRFIGHPGHAKTMRQLGSTCKIVVVHGTEDSTCRTADAREMVANLREAGLDVEPTWVSPDILDGKVFTSAGHALGNRTEIVFRVAEKYLRSDSPHALRRPSPTNFECRDALVRYQTSNGAYVVSYEAGYPVGKFDAK
jgi:predicted esterase